MLARYDLRSWWQGHEGPVTCISEPCGQIILDYQVLGHQTSTTPLVQGVARALSRYFSLTDLAPQETQRSSDIEARLGRLEAQLEQNGVKTAAAFSMG